MNPKQIVLVKLVKTKSEAEGGVSNLGPGLCQWPLRRSLAAQALTSAIALSPPDFCALFVAGGMMPNVAFAIEY